MEATPELIRTVTKAVGNLTGKNTGVIGYPSSLRSEMSQQMLEAIVRAAIEAIPVAVESAP